MHEGCCSTRAPPTTEIVDMVMKLAGEYDIPIDAKTTSRSARSARIVIVDMTYTDERRAGARRLQRDWTFTPIDVDPHADWHAR